MSDKKNKILIVDDNEEVRSLYVEVFKKENFEVEEAVDGLDGLDKANETIPDIIFTGIIMPRMDGFAFKEALSKNVNTANIPVVMSSHLGRKEDEIRAKEMGVRDFIIQGMVTPKQALRKIEELLKSDSRPAYFLKFNTEELDSLKLASDLNYSKGFKCLKCGTDMILKLRIQDTSKGEFSAQFVCPRCEK